MELSLQFNIPACLRGERGMQASDNTRQLEPNIRTPGCKLIPCFALPCSTCQQHKFSGTALRVQLQEAQMAAESKWFLLLPAGRKVVLPGVQLSWKSLCAKYQIFMLIHCHLTHEQFVLHTPYLWMCLPEHTPSGKESVFHYATLLIVKGL